MRDCCSIPRTSKMPAGKVDTAENESAANLQRKYALRRMNKCYLLFFSSKGLVLKIK